MELMAGAFAETGDFAEAVRWQQDALLSPMYLQNNDAAGRLELYRQKRPYRLEMVLPTDKK